jgi:Fe-S-cluster containining protein
VAAVQRRPAAPRPRSVALPALRGGRRIRPAADRRPVRAAGAALHHSEHRHGQANLQLTIVGTPVALSMPVPAGPARPRELLPPLREFADTVVQLGIRRAEEEGGTLSCKAGCGACCRQLVPISRSEAHRLREYVHALPEPRRSEVLGRFAEARRQLQAADVLDKLERPQGFDPEELRPLGLDYFRAGVPCPFLDEESCSIYAERPIACREYLVTSPAEECARPTPETIRCIPLAAQVSGALRKLDGGRALPAGPWVPLVLALDWAEAHPEPPPKGTGPDLLKEFFQNLLGPDRVP